MPAPSPLPSSYLLIRDFKDLKRVKQELLARAQQAQAELAARQAAAARVRLEKELFARSVGPVRALPTKHQMLPHANLAKPLPAPIAEQLLRDELAVMHEALSDEFDVETLLLTDDSLSYRRPGMGPDICIKLRRGSWSVQRHLDLHGLRRDDARETLSAFIREASKAGLRCVRVVHGKGLGSPGKTPVLKGRVQSWLVQKKEVLAFVQARPAEGGAGALMVLLAPGG